MTTGHKLFPSRQVPTYATAADFPASAGHGDLAIDLSTNTIWIYNGTAWEEASGSLDLGDTNSIDLTDNAGTLTADLRYTDTNTVNLAVGASGLSAEVKYQDSASVNLSDDTSGLKADLLISATGTPAADHFKAALSVKADGLFADVPASGVRAVTLTGYAAATGTVADTDSILGAFGKVGQHIATHSPAQVVTVAKSGGDFSTIQAAINSIGDASITKPYTVSVSPGIYTETVTLKDYVYLDGPIVGSVEIVGKVVATGLTGPTAIRNITVTYTATGDGDKIVEASGLAFGMYDCNVYARGAADYSITMVDISVAASSIFNMTCFDRRTGSITKDLDGVNFSGTGTHGMFNASVSARAAYASGTHCLFKVSSTGSFTASGGSGTYASSASFSGSVRGWCLAGATSNPRIVSGNQVRLTGTSGGTSYGVHLDSSSASGEFQFVNQSIFSTGFTNEYVSYANATDTIKMFSLSTNKDLATSGTGASVLTPYHLNQSGFIAWKGSGNYYSFVPGTGVFTLLRSCTGMVRSSPVSVAANQTFTLPANNTAYFVYATSAGILSMTTDPSFEDKILLFTLFSDGTNYAVSKQTHPAAFPSAVSGAWHNTLGSSLYNDANGILTLLSGAGKTLNVVGSTTYSDHGLNSTVEDSAGAAISLKMFYTGTASATYINGAAFTVVPSVYQDTSTTIAAIPNGKYCNFRVGVYSSNNLDDTAANQNAQYVIIPDGVGSGVVYNSASAAAAAITANSVAAFPSACKNGLEVINLGYITIRGNGTTGGGTITTVTPAKQVFGVNFASGTTSSAGSVTTDVSAFDKNLSSADTNVQLALNTLDEFNALPNNATNASASPDLTNKVAFASAADGQSATFTFDARGAIEFLIDVNTDGGMKIACDYKATTINALSDPSGLFLATDAGTGIVITKAANSAAVTVKNRMGGAKTIGILAVRSPVTATAWA